VIKMVEKYICSTCACNMDGVCGLNPPVWTSDLYGGGWSQPMVYGDTGCVSGWRPREGRIPHPDQVGLEYWK